MDEAEPFVDQDTAARLSLTIHKVRSHTSYADAATSLCAIIPVSSRSETDNVPFRLVEVIKARATLGAKRCRHKTGAMVPSVASHTPA
jgi:hypothetical protein